jgi:hypothetical protein
MEINGSVHLIGQTETVGNNGFTKRQLVVATEEQYVQYVPIDFVKDKTSVLDGYNVGDKVSVSVNVRGSEYNGKYYVNLQGWKISKTENANKEYKIKNPTYEPASLGAESENPDLPF